MASAEQTGRATRAAIGLGGAVAVAAALGLAWWLSRGGAEAPASQGAPAAALMAPDAAPVAAAQPDAAPDAVTAEPALEPAVDAAAPTPPSFDLVRVEADGAAQVAGRGAPLARIVLRVDGAQVAEADVGGDGSFVALFTLAPNPAASLLSLMMVLPDGTEVAGREAVALGPIAGPVIAMADAVTPASPVAGPDVAAPLQAEVAGSEVVQPESDPAAVLEPPAALLVTDQGVEVMQAPVIGGVGSVTIDSIGYTDDGQVQFGGRGATGQQVRLYLDNAALAETQVPAGGQWGVTKSDIAPGIYVLRADQVDATGKVTSRFETPFKRETLSALADATAPQPSGVAGTTQSVVVESGDAAAEGVASAGVAPQQPAATPSASATAVATAPAAPASPPATAGAPAEPAEPPAAVGALDVPDTATAPAAALGADVPATGAPAADTAPARAASPVSITVQPGLTLWAIAEANFGSGVRYVQVYEANKDKIRDPDLIYPGQVFTVPAEPQQPAP